MPTGLAENEPVKFKLSFILAFSFTLAFHVMPYGLFFYHLQPGTPMYFYLYDDFSVEGSSPLVVAKFIFQLGEHALLLLLSITTTLL